MRNCCIIERWISLPLSSNFQAKNSVEANKEAVDTSLSLHSTLIDHDGNRFCSEHAIMPCFVKLKKGSRHYKNTILLISKLRAASWATESIKVAVNEPLPLQADSPESSGCNQVFELPCWWSSPWRTHTHWVLAHAKVPSLFINLTRGALSVILTLTTLWLVIQMPEGTSLGRAECRVVARLLVKGGVWARD